MLKTIVGLGAYILNFTFYIIIVSQFYCSFLLVVQKKRTKEKDATKTNFRLAFVAQAIPFAKQPEIHTFRGLPPTFGSEKYNFSNTNSKTAVDIIF